MNFKVPYVLAVVFLSLLWFVVLGFFYENFRVQQAEGLSASGNLDHVKVFFVVVALLGVRGILFFSRMALEMMDIEKQTLSSGFQKS